MAAKFARRATARASPNKHKERARRGRPNGPIGATNQQEEGEEDEEWKKHNEKRKGSIGKAELFSVRGATGKSIGRTEWKRERGGRNGGTNGRTNDGRPVQTRLTHRSAQRPLLILFRRFGIFAFSGTGNGERRKPKKSSQKQNLDC
ncbi:hypothetical protein niasHT_026459 [Heterodera trifolii]|uniref:Uncharacterized protein n=1 Tax=Heterodera trifolii TaxID=157864 RepID=A0ABD2KJB9_9BILA